jgi:hypothetical protein
MVNLSGTAGSSGRSYTFTVRKNSADTLITCQIVASATSCSDMTHTATFTAGDRISLESSPSGTPSARTVVWSAQLQP